MVRHGYVNCTACHVSPSGGGILTEYGRELANELLSTWGKEGEGRFLWGAVKNPSWLQLGGDLRTVNVERETTSKTKIKKSIRMQQDFEAAVTVKKVSLVGTFGAQDKTIYPDDPYISRRHYLVYQATDEFSIRAGRFMQAFGINLPDHAIFTKQGLGWDQGSETYNIEGAYLGEKWNFYLTGVFSRADIESSQQEKGGSTSFSYSIKDKHKIGGSYFYGSSYTTNRHVFGPYAIVSFTPRFFLLTELYAQRTFPRTVADAQWGVVNYQRLNYEITQGLHVFLTQQYSNLDFDKSNKRKDTLGLGVQFFPRPHFETVFTWEKRRNLASSSDYLDWYYLMFHLYL